MRQTKRTGKLGLKSYLPVMFWLAALCFATVPRANAALKIHLNFLPSTPPTNMVGGGNLVDIVNVAARSWERAFADPGDTWDVYLDVEWAPLGHLGQFTLYEQGGTPHREQCGLVQFSNLGNLPLFADPTPEDSCEYQTYTEYTNDFGGGIVNLGRVWSDPTGDAVGRYDLLELATHEIGHSLGLSDENTQFKLEVPGNNLVIVSPRPHPHTLLFMSTDHIAEHTALMYNFNAAGERKLITGIDILAEAQLSKFNKPNLNPYSSVKSAPYIANIEVFGATLTIRGTNGTPKGPYVLLSTTNLSLPFAQWTHVLTNHFDCGGNFYVSTNLLNPASLRQFYILAQ